MSISLSETPGRILKTMNNALECLKYAGKYEKYAIKFLPQVQLTVLIKSFVQSKSIHT